MSNVRFDELELMLMAMFEQPTLKDTIQVLTEIQPLIAEDINPQKSERELKNRLNRKKNFMRREWQERAQGKYVLRYKGENITIMKSKFGAGWGVLYGGQSVFRYNNRRIDDFHTARLIAFDLFDEQHESRGEVQPYWDGMRWLYY